MRMRYIIILVLLLLNISHLDLSWAQGSMKNRSSRDVSCRESLEYEHDNICCLNCPAGTFVKTACLTASEKGECKTCEFDTYTEHENGLQKCLSCSMCRIDQETTEKCTITQNTKCKCKQGSFCLPDQACEVCKKCSRCKEDEETVKGCTHISNTVCRKRSSSGSSISVTFIVVPLIAMLACILCIVYWTKSKPSKGAVTSRSPREMVKICMGDNEEVIEERQNAQNSKINDSSQLQPFLEQNYTEREWSRRVVPLNGEESLKKTFDFFEEMDVHYHNRFFRFIGLSDNSIKSTDSLFPEDRVYELLKIWMEKEGLKADFNSLIEALIYLDQRLSAENIVTKAVSNGYFKYEDE
ncbi:hematopoietic death receptor isoform X2 [Pimephales promelas]|uniref:hematopoietic death receptor isoform X2 n=1 Tax=Pimephales promelas TaxID=90988 RepID=UPI001955B922|nr:hematopoietic death receptor isoform X2 [Pimephales promelas]